MAERRPAFAPPRSALVSSGEAPIAKRLAAELVTDLYLGLRFFSRLPLPLRSAEATSAAFPGFSRAARMVPLAGMIIGLVAMLPLVVATALGLAPTLASALTVGVSVLLTGALHEDGLADCADGFGGGRSRERKLEIMRDSRIGTYGTIALVLAFFVRVESLAEIATRSVALAATTLVVAAALSRTAALVPAVLLAPARTDGSGHAAGRPQPQPFATALVVAALLAAAPIPAGADPGAVLFALVATAGLAIGAAGFAYRQIGGHTGDVAGAVQQLTELAILLAIAAS